jgi:S1-C subfamily serine protease
LFVTSATCHAQEEATEDEALGARAAQYQELAKEVGFLERQSNVLKKVARLVVPTVVHIDAEKSLYGRRSDVEETGSGFIVRLGDAYYAVTNRHVIKNANLPDIKIRLSDGRVVNPKRVWSDPETDIAIMALAAPQLAASAVGDSDRLEIGDFVLAVGSPFSLSHSVTFGIISAKGRRDLKLGDDVRFQDFLQTDAAINPGSSGGPLVNLEGEVVGINTAIASHSGSNSGVAFSIPVNLVKRVVKQLVDKGAVSRGYLGVHLAQTMEPADALKLGLERSQGALVENIYLESPAAQAGLRANDVILQMDGVTIRNENHLINMISALPAGQRVRLQIWRDRKAIMAEALVGDWSKAQSKLRSQ